MVEPLAAQLGSEATLSDHQQQRASPSRRGRPALPLHSNRCCARSSFPNEADAHANGSPRSRNSLTTLSLSTLLTAPTIAAWQSIADQLRRTRAPRHVARRTAAQLSRARCSSTLIDVATHESLPRAHDDVGRVRVLSAASRPHGLRQACVPGRHVGAGVSRRPSAPAASPPTPTTASSPRRTTKSRSAEPSANAAATRSQEEMLLFYEVLSRAEESLTISYPALDDKAQDAAAQPVRHRTRAHVRRRQARSAASAASAAALADSRSPATPLEPIADWRIQAVAERSRAEARPPPAGRIVLAPTTRSRSAHAIDAGLRIVHARARGESFGPAEGLLDKPRRRRPARRALRPAALVEPQPVGNVRGLPVQVLSAERARARAARRPGAGNRLSPAAAAGCTTCWRRSTASGATLRGERPRLPDDEAAQFVDHLQRRHRRADRRRARRRHRCRAARARSPADPQMGRAALRSPREIRRRLVQARRADGARPLRAPLRPAAPRRRRQTIPTRSTMRSSLDIDGETDPRHRPDRSHRRRPRRRPNGVQCHRLQVGQASRRFKREQHRIRRATAAADLRRGRASARCSTATPRRWPPATGRWPAASTPRAALAVEARGDARRALDRDCRPRSTSCIGQFVDAIRRGEFPVASRDDQCTSRCDFNTVCRIAQVRSLGKTWCARTSTIQDRKPASRIAQSSSTELRQSAIRNSDARRCTHRRTDAPRSTRAMSRSRSPPAPAAARRSSSPSGSSRISIRRQRATRAGQAQPTDRHHVHRRRGPRNARRASATRATSGCKHAETRRRRADHWLRLLREIDTARVSTIHAFCTSLLRAHAADAGLDPTFGVLDQGDADVLQFDVIDDVLREQLAELDDDTLDLAAAFGLAQLKQQIAALLGQPPRRRISQVARTRRRSEARRPLAASGTTTKHSRIALREIAAEAPVDDILELLRDRRSRRKAEVCRSPSDAAGTAAAARDSERHCERAERIAIRPRSRARCKASARPRIGRQPTTYDAYRERVRSTARLRSTSISRSHSTDARRPRSGRAWPRPAAAHRKGRRRIRRPQNAPRASSISTTCCRAPTDLSPIRKNDGAPRAARRRPAAAPGRRVSRHRPAASRPRASALRRRASTPAGCSSSATSSNRSTASAAPSRPCFATCASEIDEAGRLPLTLNFRSQPGILDFVNALFCDAFTAKATTTNRCAPAASKPPTPPCRRIPVDDHAGQKQPKHRRRAREARREEARTIARRLRALIDDETHRAARSSTRTPKQPRRARARRRRHPVPHAQRRAGVRRSTPRIRASTITSSAATPFTPSRKSTTC